MSRTLAEAWTAFAGHVTTLGEQPAPQQVIAQAIWLSGAASALTAVSQLVGHGHDCRAVLERLLAEAEVLMLGVQMPLKSQPSESPNTNPTG